MGHAQGTRKSKQERRVEAFAERLRAAQLAVELRDLQAAGASRRALNIWRQRGEGKSEHALAQHLGMTLKAVQMSLARSSDRLLTYREAHLPEVPCPADWADSGLPWDMWLRVCAGVAVDLAIDRPERGQRAA